MCILLKTNQKGKSLMNNFVHVNESRSDSLSWVEVDVELTQMRPPDSWIQDLRAKDQWP